MINKLIINEVTPVTDGSIPIITNGKLFNGEDLESKIHNFFKRHIERSFDNPKMKSMRFSNFNSTLFNSSKSLLTSSNNEVIDNEFFIKENEIVTKKFAENIHKNVTNPFLFIVLSFSYESSEDIIEMGDINPIDPALPAAAVNIQEFTPAEVEFTEQEIAIAETAVTFDATEETTTVVSQSITEEILCFIKMERLDGVQYTAQNFNVQPDMLPDFKTDLQKCAFIFKNKIINLQETDFTNIDVVENPEDNKLDFHSKVLDRQDENISKYFMTSFLESYPIAKDAEVTKLVHKFVSAELSKFVKEPYSIKEIDNYVENELQKRNRTSLSRIVEDVVNNSNFINYERIESMNLDVEKISMSIFHNMRKENNSVYQEFTSSPEIIEKSSIKDIESDGRDIKIFISKMYQAYGYATIDTNTSDQYVTISLNKDKIRIKH